jgi:hypothetical protein
MGVPIVRPIVPPIVPIVMVRPNEVTSALGVQGRIMLLPGEICPALRPPAGGSASCSNALGDWAEVSRRHSSGFLMDEAKA